MVHSQGNTFDDNRRRKIGDWCWGDDVSNTTTTRIRAVPTNVNSNGTVRSVTVSSSATNSNDPSTSAGSFVPSSRLKRKQEQTDPPMPKDPALSESTLPVPTIAPSSTTRTTKAKPSEDRDSNANAAPTSSPFPAMASLPPLNVASINSVFSVLPVIEIRATFRHKPESYEVDLHPTRQAILKIRKKLMANLASLPCDIPNFNNNWKWVLMTESEYLLAQCRQHGYDPNLPAKVKLGKDAGNIFVCPKVQSAGLYEPPDTESVAQIYNAETKHNKATAGFGHVLSAIVNTKACTTAHASLRFQSRNLSCLARHAHQYHVVTHHTTGKQLEYRDLIKYPFYKQTWLASGAIKLGQLAHWLPSRNVKGTDTIFFIKKHPVPTDRTSPMLALYAHSGLKKTISIKLE